MIKKEDYKYFELPGVFPVPILGNANVGKTSLVKKYIQILDESVPNLCAYAHLNASATNYSKSSVISTQTKLHSPFSSNLQIQFFDLRAVPSVDQTSILCKFSTSAAVVFVYDITCFPSFLDIKNVWLKIRAYILPTTPLFLVGNKKDLEATNRKVSRADGENFAAENNMQFFETSALLNENVIEIFDTLLKIMLGKELEYRKQIEKISPPSADAVELHYRRRKICSIS